MNAAPTLDTPSIATERFTLRKLVREDTSALFPTFSNETQCRYMSQPHFATMEALADWLTDSTWAGRSWVAMDKSDGSVAGRYVAYPGRDAGVLELGYITVAQRQGQGVATECMAALVDHLFQNEGYRRLFAEIDAENAASTALIERLGFVREGCLREHETTHKGVCDTVVYGLLYREWRSGTAQTS
ncbi:RimJ/RimL family protein N-acetyltransferase [Azospirillum agricola]|uniref:GNAT family N-acetyltransferase n=1 Tax=Azospirillum agricola TaxID=1720247 RepID=UPI001AE97F6F|nr:GNAT family protein [Azospirillum agricola]MBP2233380.1 RimJ/RimL family protein N-acetyltransferase [Azospirillum agricola]